MEAVCTLENIASAQRAADSEGGHFEEAQSRKEPAAVLG